MTIFEEILKARGLTGRKRDAFLHPSYDAKHDPFLLPDMQAAVDRLVRARQTQEKITIYGDYDIDGLTATTVLLDSFDSFGFEHVDAFIPNRFVEGYGLTVDAVERIAAQGAQLIITVDCGSLSEKEIIRAGELGVDVIVTDHHNVAPVQPPAVAVINPKRLLQDYPDVYENYLLKLDFATNSSNTIAPSRDDLGNDSLSSAELVGAQTSSTSQESSPKSSGRHKVFSEFVTKSQPSLYPFLDLAGVGVAFKLVQALQTRLEGLEQGQEKWLLDLVALGTVCDVVTLLDENRANVYWGLKVLAKARRPGLRALMAVAGVEPEQVNARSLGFGLGPRMNAAGRLETARYAIDMLRAKEPMYALEKAQQLDVLNTARRSEQDKILKEAITQAEKYTNDNVLVVSSPGWSHGIIGIVAAKLLEKYNKPTFVFEELPAEHEHSVQALGGEDSNSLRSEPEGRIPPQIRSEESKGSARSFGDFSAADAIRAADDLIIKGGGHKLAAGVTLPTQNINAFRTRVNEFYKTQKYKDQSLLLLPHIDLYVDSLATIDESLLEQLSSLEPFGSGNPEPVLHSKNVLVINQRKMGAASQHVKLEVQDNTGKTIHLLAFSAPEHFFVEPGERVNVWFQPTLNEWMGRRSVEGRLLHLELHS